MHPKKVEQLTKISTLIICTTRNIFPHLGTLICHVYGGLSEIRLSAISQRAEATGAQHPMGSPVVAELGRCDSLTFDYWPKITVFTKSDACRSLSRSLLTRPMGGGDLLPYCTGERHGGRSLPEYNRPASKWIEGSLLPRLSW